MSEDEYVERIREMDEATSPTRQILLETTPTGETPTPRAGEPVNLGATFRELMFGPATTQQKEYDAWRKEVGPLGSPEALEHSAEGAARMPQPGKLTLPTDAAAEVMREPIARRVLNHSLKLVTGLDLDELHGAITAGTLPDQVLKPLEGVGRTIEDVATETARRAGLPEDVVQKIAGASGMLAAAMMPPGGKGKPAKAGAAAGAGVAESLGRIFADEAGALFPRRSRRVVRLTDVRPTDVEPTGIPLGPKQIKVDWSKVDTTGDIAAVIERVAAVSKDRWFDAKRGVIHDEEMAQFAARDGIDLKTLLMRREGTSSLTAEQTFAAYMAMGDLARQFKALRDLGERATPEQDLAMKNMAVLLVSAMPELRADISESGRKVRIAGLEIPFLKEAKDFGETLGVMGRTVIEGMSAKELREATAGLTTATQLMTWARFMKGLGGAFAGGVAGEYVGETVGGTAGAVVGTALGAGMGFAVGVNPSVLLEAWINGLLSGPQTYVVNVTSELGSTFLGVMERALAARHGSGGAPERIVPGEAAVMANAAAGFMWDSLLVYAKTLASEPGRVTLRAGAGAAVGLGVSDNPDQMLVNAPIAAGVAAGLSPRVFLRPDELMRKRELSAAGLGMSGSLGRFADVVGSLVRLPSRGLVQADDWIKAMNVQMELHAMAHRQAVLSGAAPGSREYAKAASEFLRAPNAEVMDRAREYATYIAFQSSTNSEIAGLGKERSAIFRFIAPFVMTPTNILKQAFERMPIVNRLGDGLRADLAAGGVRRQLAQAKTDTGIAMASLAWYLASTGVIVGSGPLKTEDRQLWETQRRLPNSVGLPGSDKRVSFSRLDPVGLFVGTIADIQNMSAEIPPWQLQWYLGATIVAFSNQFLDKSFVTGVAQLVEALTEARKGNFKLLDNWSEHMAGSVIPTGVYTVSRALDPAKSEVSTLVDLLRSRTRGFSDDPDVPIRRDFFNQPVTWPHTGYVVLDALNPFYVQQETADDKIKAIVAALQKDKIGVTGPPKVLGGAEESSALDPSPNDAPGVHLTAQQHNDFIRLFNTVEIGDQRLKDALHSLVTSEGYTTLGPIGRSMRVKRLVYGYKKLAEDELLAKYPALAAKVEASRGRRMELIEPGSTGGEYSAKPKPPTSLIPSLGR